MSETKIFWILLDRSGSLYYDCYDETYREVVTGCNTFLEYLKQEGKIE